MIPFVITPLAALIVCFLIGKYTRPKQVYHIDETGALTLKNELQCRN